MTRWKREETTVIISMHAHNQWSNWYSCLENAAKELGLPVQMREFSNHWDGSRDREWRVSTAWLNRVGGLKALHALADTYHRDMYREVEF